MMFACRAFRAGEGCTVTIAKSHEPVVLFDRSKYTAEQLARGEAVFKSLSLEDQRELIEAQAER